MAVTLNIRVIIYLFEASPINPSTGVTSTVRFASNTAFGGAGTNLDGKAWEPALVGEPTQRVSFFGQGAVQAISIDNGSVAIELNALTTYLSQQVWDGALGRLWMGEHGADFSTYEKIFEGTLGPHSREANVLRVPLYGRDFTLSETPILTAKYAGTGGIEGPPALIGKWKPRAYGSCRYVTPVLINSAYQVYQVNDGPVTNITAVYENAYVVSASKGDAANYSDLIGYDLKPGELITCVALGLFRLGAAPSGKITADVTGRTNAGSTLASITQRILLEAGVLASDIDMASINTVGAAKSWCLYLEEQANAGELLKEAYAGAWCYIFADNLGILRAGDWLANGSMLDLEIVPGSLTMPGTAAANYSVTINAERCWSRHSESEISPAIIELQADQAAINEVALAANATANQVKANTAILTAQVEDISKDSVLAPDEKATIKQKYAELTNLKATLNAQASGFLITTENAALNTAYANLSSYLTGLSPSWTNTAVSTTIVRTDFDSAWTNAASAADGLAGKIAQVAATKANWPNIPDRPNSVATLNPIDGAKLAGIEEGATKGAPFGTYIGNVIVNDIIATMQKVAPYTDTTPSAVPTGLALNSTITDTGATLAATWTAVSDPDLAMYELEVTEAGGIANIYPSTGLRYEFRGVRRNTAYTARIRSVDKASNRSIFSNAVTHTTARDLVAPAVATGLTAEPSFATIVLSWTNPADADLEAAEVWHNTANSSATATKLVTVQAGPSTRQSHIHGSLARASAHYYWLKTVDTSGNTSGFSAGSGLITTTLVDITDVAPAVNQGLTQTVTSLPNPATWTGGPTVYNSTDGKLYRIANGVWSTAVSTTDLSGLVAPAQVDQRNFYIRDSIGSPVFGPDGFISSIANFNLNGNNVLLSDVVANSLQPQINFVGEFASPPTSAQLGDEYKQNAVYKNSTDGRSYILTGSPLGWEIWLVDGTNFQVSIESSNGNIFKIGQGTSSLLKARLFKNGAEITATADPNWFKWRRVSKYPREAPYDDATFNTQYAQGYKQISITTNDVYASATYFVDVSN